MNIFKGIVEGRKRKLKKREQYWIAGLLFFIFLLMVSYMLGNRTDLFSRVIDRYMSEKKRGRF